MHHPPNDHRHALSPPQFGLRGMLLLIAVLCVLFAVGAAWGAKPALGLLLILLSLGAHFAAAAVGQQLRDHGSRPLDTHSTTSSSAKISPVRAKPLDSDFAPTTNLGERRSLGWLLYVGVTGGAAFGAISGWCWIVLRFGPRATVEIQAVGLVAFALLGAFAAFLLVGFLQVAVRALLHAQRSS
jgi:hypothetical protein